MEKNYKLEVDEYGNVKEMPDDWKLTKLTVRQLKKTGIPNYKILLEFKKYHGKYYPIYANIIPKDFSDKEEQYVKELAKEKEKAINKIKKSEEYSLKCLATCLYSINKEAKRQRDIKEDHAGKVYDGLQDLSAEERCRQHYFIYKAKNREAELYELKDTALKLIIEQWKIKPVGYHKFKGSNSKRDYYEIDGYGFHSNECTSDNYLGRIKEEISAERKRSTPPKKAEIILKEYINRTKGIK